MLLRMLDANANRAREALRVMEDYTRFALSDEVLSTELKHIRHALAATLTALHVDGAMFCRDTENDVGVTIKTDRELRRDSLASVVTAAGKRFSESLRVLEECAKTLHPAFATQLEQLRYRGYSLEKTLNTITGGNDLRQKFEQVRLYVLLTDTLCHPTIGGGQSEPRPSGSDRAAMQERCLSLPHGRGSDCPSRWEHVLDQILSVTQDFSLCIQLREKNLADAELLRRAKILADKCRRHRAISIINDRPDIALLSHADGVHLGQEDMPCAEARKLLGHGKIVGVSTENMSQATAALHAGATYIAVGPMFSTQTKDKPRIVGPTYAAEAQQKIPLPLVPIGGITLDNLHHLTQLGIPRVAVCSAIISQENPASATCAFLEKLQPSQSN